MRRRIKDGADKAARLKRRVNYGALVLAALMAAQPLAAQNAVAPSLSRRFSSAVSPAPSLDSLARRSWVPPVASLIVPGSGQLLRGRSRGLLNLALEVWLIARVVAWDRTADREAQEYRDLAFNVARRAFTDLRQDGPFEYYETMEKWVESGEFDLDPGPGFQPETDTSTFNGSVWLLARRTFFSHPDSIPNPESPAFIGAMAFYRTRAATDDFRWSWRNAQLEQDAFRSVIRSSDEAYRQRTNFLGALVLNHIASAVDAFLSARGRRPVAAPRMDFRSNPEEMRLSWSIEF